MQIYIKNNKYTKIALLAFIIYGLTFLAYIDHQSNDFKCYYSAIQFLHKFPLEKIYDSELFMKFTRDSIISTFEWFYPPHYFFHLYIFGLFPFAIANFLFTICGLVLFIFAVYLWCQRIDFTQNIIFYTIATPFMACVLMTSQNSVYTASFLLIGLHFLDKRPIVAGLFFSLLTYKPQFIALIPIALLMTKHYKTFAYASIFFIIQGFVSILVFGIEPWVSFFQKSSMILDLIADNRLSYHIMASSFPTLIQFGVPKEIAQIISTIWLIFIAMIALHIWYIRKGDALAKAILVTATCLVTPYMFFYDVFILSVAILFYLEHKNFKLFFLDIQLLQLWIYIYMILMFISFFKFSIGLYVVSPILLFVFLVFRSGNIFLPQFVLRKKIESV